MPTTPNKWFKIYVLISSFVSLNFPLSHCLLLNFVYPPPPHKKIVHKNSPFPSCAKPPFQVRSHCYVMKMTLYSHFHKRGLALILALKVRAFRTRKWPILSTTVVLRESEKQCFCKRETRLIIGKAKVANTTDFF